jgi:hypothetical protein
MTSQLDAGSTPGTTTTAGSDGSSVYGGRPTFALSRRDGPNGGTVTMYELLLDAQAAARRDRLERRGRTLRMESFDDVFGDSTSDKVEEWVWEDWTAVKLARLSGGRLRSLLPLVRESLEGADLDATTVTSTGDGDVFLPETVGVRLALAFRGIKPIQRVDRMRAFCRGIARMGDEECYYWHAKCRAPSSPNGEKALRTLLTDHL